MPDKLISEGESRNQWIQLSKIAKLSPPNPVQAGPIPLRRGRVLINPEPN